MAEETENACLPSPVCEGCLFYFKWSVTGLGGWIIVAVGTDFLTAHPNGLNRSTRKKLDELTFLSTKLSLYRDSGN